MSLLDKLWDDTVAGPRPETGLGKLRKHPTFTSRPSSGKETNVANAEKEVKVTRSIMIVKPPQGTGQNGSPPVSPAGSTPPVSPFAGSREAYRFRRRSTSDAYEKAGGAGPRSPAPPYDM
ncbi:hypothetical protein NMG60_11020821 [Bertholletia excelsa]